MKKRIILSFVFTFAIVGISVGFAADGAQDAYGVYAQKVAPLEQQLNFKQAELDAIYANPQPDTAKAQQLYKEIGELKGQLFAAEAELRAQLGESDMSYSGGHHNGYRGHDGYRGRRGGGYIGHGGGRHCGW
ncbi:MAG: hypothetical protein LBJ46_08635 [Planctomycetota bacterium]|jgi:peptidoglycan hydrolase CwlO-like protein|nr:hypothetical protein [Planctomycetota bacterium]